MSTLRLVYRNVFKNVSALHLDTYIILVVVYVSLSLSHVYRKKNVFQLVTTHQLFARALSFSPSKFYLLFARCLPFSVLADNRCHSTAASPSSTGARVSGLMCWTNSHGGFRGKKSSESNCSTVHVGHIRSPQT